MTSRMLSAQAAGSPPVVAPRPPGALALTRAATGSPAGLEVLDRALARFRLSTRPERAQIASVSCLRIFLPRVEPVSAGAELPDHRVSSVLTLPLVPAGRARVQSGAALGRRRALVDGRVDDAGAQELGDARSGVAEEVDEHGARVLAYAIGRRATRVDRLAVDVIRAGGHAHGAAAGMRHDWKGLSLGHVRLR